MKIYKQVTIYLCLAQMCRKRILSIICLVFVCTIVHSTSAQEKREGWTLRACIEHAREHHLQVEYARVALANTGIELIRAKSQRLPSLDFSTAQGWGQQKSINESGKLKSVNRYTGNYTLGGDLPLYEGGKLMNLIRQQKSLEQVQEQEILVVQNEIEIAVAKAYLQILYAEEILKTDSQTSKNSEEQLIRAKELFHAGSISSSDLAQFESQYSSDCYRKVQAENDLAFSKLQLKQLLELGLEQNFDIIFPELGDRDVLVLIPSLEEVYHEALNLMPEMRSRELGFDAALQGEKVARSGYLPSVSFNASITTNHDSKSRGSGISQINDRLAENIAINVRIPITDKKQNRLNVSKARLQTEQARLDGLNTRKDLLKTIESLHQDVISAQSRYVAACARVKAAETSYSRVQEEFNVGIKNAVELFVEKNNYLSALQEQVQAKYQAVLSVKLLNFYRNEPIDM